MARARPGKRVFCKQYNGTKLLFNSEDVAKRQMRLTGREMIRSPNKYIAMQPRPIDIYRCRSCEGWHMTTHITGVV
jgi:hypothetical protein